MGLGWNADSNYKIFYLSIRVVCEMGQSSGTELGRVIYVFVILCCSM